MVKYIAKRVLMMIPVLLGVILLVFFIMNLASGNAVLLILGENATEEAVAAKTQELGLDQPILVRYFNYLADLMRGDMGMSYFSSRSVADEVLTRFPATLKLAVVSAIISTLLAIPLGIFAAVKQNTLFDNFSMILSLVGNSMPAFWLALMLMMLFAEKLGWLPAQGMNDGWRSYVLPAVSIGFINMAAIAGLYPHRPGQGHRRECGGDGPCLPQRPDPHHYGYRRPVRQPAGRGDSGRDRICLARTGPADGPVGQQPGRAAGAGLYRHFEHQLLCRQPAGGLGLWLCGPAGPVHV